MSADALYPAFELMRLALQEAGHYEGEVVATFRARTAQTSWCRSSIGAANLKQTSIEFENLWLERNVAQSFGSMEALKHEVARWTLALRESDRDASLIDLSRLALWLARAATPGLWSRSRCRTNASIWKNAIYDAANHAASYLDIHEGAEARSGVDTGAEGRAEKIQTAHRTSPMQPEIESPVQWRAYSPDSLLRWTKGELNVRLVRKRAETHDVMTFELAPIEATELVYLPGQSVALSLQIDGEEVRRSYTISSAPSRKDRLWITVKRVAGGKASNWLMDHAELGLELKLRGPHGKFSWAKEKPSKVLLLSAGSGITPMLSMARYCADLFPDTDIVFWHATRSQSDLFSRDELSLYEKRLDDFRVVYSLSREPTTSDWRGLRGRCSTESLFSSVPDILERTIFLCGPSQFRSLVRQSLDELGFDVSRFHAESFGGASAKRVTSQINARKWQRQNLNELLPAPSRMRGVLTEGLPKIDVDEGGSDAPKEPPSTTQQNETPENAEIFVSGYSGSPILIDKASTVLELLETAEIPIDNSCRMGVCGACKARCLRGTVAFENAGGLTEEEEKQGWILPCTSYAESELEVEV